MIRGTGTNKKKALKADSSELLPITVIRRILDRHYGSKALVAQRVRSGWSVARGLANRERPVSRPAVYSWLKGRSTSHAIHIAADAVARELLEKERAEKSARAMKAGAA